MPATKDPFGKASANLVFLVQAFKGKNRVKLMCSVDWVSISRLNNNHIFSFDCCQCFTGMETWRTGLSWTARTSRGTVKSSDMTDLDSDVPIEKFFLSFGSPLFMRGRLLSQGILIARRKLSFGWYSVVEQLVRTPTSSLDRTDLPKITFAPAMCQAIFQ